MPFPVGPSGDKDSTPGTVGFYGIGEGAKNPTGGAAYIYLFCRQDYLKRGEYLRSYFTEEQAKLHPDRNKITRAIGAEEMVTPDYFELDLADGDMLLLCSDGLSSYGDDMDILDICFEYPTEEICDKLVDYANGNGGHDNISVALIAV